MVDTKTMRAASMAVILATDEAVANDLSPMLRNAANEIDALRLRAEQAEKERDALRVIISEATAAIGNGSSCSTAASVDFMAGLPNEIRMAMEQAEARCKRLEGATRMLIGCIEDTKRYPDMRDDFVEELEAASKALEDK